MSFLLLMTVSLALCTASSNLSPLHTPQIVDLIFRTVHNFTATFFLNIFFCVHRGAAWRAFFATAVSSIPHDHPVLPRSPLAPIFLIYCQLYIELRSFCMHAFGNSVAVLLTLRNGWGTVGNECSVG